MSLSLLALAAGHLWRSAKLHFLERNNISMDLQVNFTSKNSRPDLDNFRCCLTQQRMVHLLAALNHVPPTLLDSGLRLEFGVRNAQSINWLANMSEAARMATWHGFDSFVGLPASKNGKHESGEWRAGAYSTGGILPPVLPNVRLHPGWFNETLATLLGELKDHPVAFVHMDADIYESTALVLEEIFRRCAHRVGTVFAFDEMFGPPAQEEHELRALRESSARWNVSWKFITFALTPTSSFGRAAVQVVETGEGCERTATPETYQHLHRRHVALAQRVHRLEEALRGAVALLREQLAGS